MSETALSEATMLASLRDIRLPAEAAGGMWTEYAAVAGVAALAAVFTVAVLRLLSKRSISARPIVTREESLDRKDWSEGRRRVALLHRLRELDAERYAELKGGLYRPCGDPDLALLEEEVSRRV